MARENPYAGLVASLDADGLGALTSALSERRCREEGAGGGEDEKGPPRAAQGPSC